MSRRIVALLLCLCPVLSACSGPTDAPPRRVRAHTTPSPTPSPSPSPTPWPTDPFALARWKESQDPAELATRLTEAERTIRDPAASGLEEAALVQQTAYRQLVEHPDWVRPAKERIPEDLHPTLEANVTAGSELRALTKPRPDLPGHWRIVAPRPPDELRRYYREAADAFGIDWTFLAAIHLVETRFGRIRGTSVAGAQGPMQFMPSTWEAYGEGDVNDDRDAIFAAARYLAAHGAPQDMPRALYAYNHSNRYVRAVSLYASEMRRNERAFAGYYHWQVFYRTTRGDALLPVGWGEDRT